MKMYCVIEKDFQFIPLKGERVDAHTFIPQVFEAGALITLSDRDLEGVPYIRVKDTEKALTVPKGRMLAAQYLMR